MVPKDGYAVKSVAEKLQSTTIWSKLHNSKSPMRLSRQLHDTMSKRTAALKKKTLTRLNKETIAVLAETVIAFRKTPKFEGRRPLGKVIQPKADGISGEQKEHRQNEEAVDSPQSGEQTDDVVVEQESDRDDTESEVEEEHEAQSSQTKRRSVVGERTSSTIEVHDSGEMSAKI